MQISVLILLYDERPEESVTVQHILSSGIDISLFNFVLWNNGPHPWAKGDFDWIEKRIPGAHIAETLENRPLSHIYNTFIADFPAEKYLFLDDDSSLTLTYLEDVVNYSDEGVAIPVVTFNGEIDRPVVRGVVNTGPYQSNELVHMVGSGVVLHSSIAKIIQDHFGTVFDEDFAFYGVDTSLFMRLARLGVSDQITCVNGFEHSNSFYEEEERDVKSFRKIEMTKSLAVNHRKNRQFFPAMVFVRTVLSILLGKRKDVDIGTYITSYTKGKHNMSDLKYPPIIYSQTERVS